jgi:hypothetical protein
MSEVASRIPTDVVLVHGGFVDGSGWEGVYKILKKEGFAVSTEVIGAERVLPATAAPSYIQGEVRANNSMDPTQPGQCLAWARYQP